MDSMVEFSVASWIGIDPVGFPCPFSYRGYACIFSQFITALKPLDTYNLSHDLTGSQMSTAMKVGVELLDSGDTFTLLFERRVNFFNLSGNHFKPSNPAQNALSKRRRRRFLLNRERVPLKGFRGEDVFKGLTVPIAVVLMEKHMKLSLEPGFLFYEIVPFLQQQINASYSFFLRWYTGLERVVSLHIGEG